MRCMDMRAALTCGEHPVWELCIVLVLFEEIKDWLHFKHADMYGEPTPFSQPNRQMIVRYPPDVEMS